MNFRNRIKILLTIAAVTTSLLASTSIAVDVVGELGILDVTANGGINPNTGTPWQVGDQYRLAFHTVGATGTLNGTSNDPAVYNDYVTAEAGANPLLAGTVWFALVTVNLDSTVPEASSPKSDPRVISGTDDLSGGAGIGGAGVPVYAMDGTTCIARNNADIWNSWSNPFDGDSAVRVAPPVSSQNVHYSPFLDQFGNQTVNPDNVHGIDVATGCGSNGAPVNPLGTTTDNTTMNRGNANANSTSRIWNRFTNNITDNLSYYALSELLTIQDANADPNLPDVETVDNWITWSGQPVTINATVINNDTQGRTLEYAWIDDAPAGYTVEVVDGAADPEDATITITKDADTDDAEVVTMTLAVTLNGVGTVEDSFTIDVYDNACDAAVAVYTETIFDPADFNKDCITDVKDVALMAMEWLVDYSLKDSSVAP